MTNGEITDAMRYELFVRPTNKPGADDISIELHSSTTLASARCDAWCRDLNAAHSWVVDRRTNATIYDCTGHGVFAYDQTDRPAYDLED